jgi:hypothetical protein
MVDALKRVRGWLAPHGVVVDFHPTALVATILVGDAVAGPIDPGGATDRHQAATDAIASTVETGIFAIEDSLAFEFSTWADSLEELNEHILEDWREARIGDETLAQARALLAAEPRAKVRVRERVSAVRLRVIRT